MEPNDIKAWVDVIGPTGAIVLLFALVVLPAIRRFNSEKSELPASTQVSLALMQKALEDLDARVKALETKPRR